MLLRFSEYGDRDFLLEYSRIYLDHEMVISLDLWWVPLPGWASEELETTQSAPIGPESWEWIIPKPLMNLENSLGLLLCLLWLGCKASIAKISSTSYGTDGFFVQYSPKKKQDRDSLIHVDRKSLAGKTYCSLGSFPGLGCPRYWLLSEWTALFNGDTARGRAN